MATDLQEHRTHNEPSVTSLVTGIINDAQDLFKQEFELLKHEVREDIKKTRDAGYTLGAGAALALVGAILLTQMLVYLVQWATGWPLWVCFGIWGVVIFGGAAALILVGKNTLESVDPIPEKTVQTVKENVEWATNSK